MDEELQEQDIVFGTINIMESPNTANRFMIRGFLTLIFLHQKKMYHYHEMTRDFDSLKEFVRGGFESGDGNSTWEEIPMPPSKVEFYMKMFKVIGMELADAARGNNGPAGYTILLLVGMLFSKFITIISMFFLPETTSASKDKVH